MNTRSLRYICSKCGSSVPVKSCDKLFPKIKNNSRIFNLRLLHSSQWGLSEVKLLERPVTEMFNEADQETLMEKQYADLQRAIGINTLHANNSEQLLLIHPRVRWGSESVPKNTTTNLQIEEAQALCQSLPGLRIARTIIVNTDYNLRKKTIWKDGRLQAILAYKQQHNISALVINIDMLSPIQQRELTAYFNVPVYDRYSIVLAIFKLYARTREARLQIALAEIPYIRSRVKFINSEPDESDEVKQIVPAISSLKTTNDGCKKLDILRLREHKIKKQIKMAMETAKQELINEKERISGDKTTKSPLIGVIGLETNLNNRYTNSGKTTLIRKLTDSHKFYGENRLFATLDTTTHSAVLPSSCKIIFADTIGFISNLPIQLFASFSATLQHVENADLLIHIMDLSHPDLLAQRDNVLSTLENLKIRQPLIDGILNVGNKLDKCDTARREQLMEWGILPKPDVEQGQKSPSIFPISCRTLEGIPLLIGHLDKSVQIINGSRVRRLRLNHVSKAIPYLYDHGFVVTPPVPSECGNFLFFDIVMNDQQFAKFQAAIGTRFKRKEEQQNDE